MVLLPVFKAYHRFIQDAKTGYRVIQNAQHTSRYLEKPRSEALKNEGHSHQKSYAIPIKTLKNGL